MKDITPVTDFAIEFAENPESRVPVILLLDTSASMSGEAIKQLNTGVQQFLEEVLSDAQAASSVELAIIAVGGDAPKVIQEFATVDKIRVPTLEADGMTPMGTALHQAMDMLNTRKQVYRDNGIPYYCPWLFALTDGQPSDSYQSAANRIKQEEGFKRLQFFLVGVGDTVNHTILKELAGDKGPQQLKGLEFKAMFSWLSASMKQVSTSTVGSVVALPPTSGWGMTIS